MSCFWGHRWSKWAVYEENGIAMDRRGLFEHPYSQTRQRRTCERCGYSQDCLLKQGHDPLAIIPAQEEGGK